MDKKNKEARGGELVKVGALANGMVVYKNTDKVLPPVIEDELPEMLSQITPLARKKNSTGLRGGPYVANLSRALPSYRVPILPGDELCLAQRVGRAGYSVFVLNRQPIYVETGTVILSFHGPDVPKNSALLVTAFVGTPAPREPWDDWYRGGGSFHERTYRNKEQDEALGFWLREALILDEDFFPLVNGSTLPFCSVDQKDIDRLCAKIQ